MFKTASFKYTVCTTINKVRRKLAVRVDGLVVKLEGFREGSWDFWDGGL
jgi:hypothetical protein